MRRRIAGVRSDVFLATECSDIMVRKEVVHAQALLRGLGTHGVVSSRLIATLGILKPFTEAIRTRTLGRLHASLTTMQLIE